MFQITIMHKQCFLFSKYIFGNKKFSIYTFAIKGIKFTLEYSETCLKWPLKKETKTGFQDQLWVNAGQSIAECSKRKLLQYFRPSLTYHFVIKIFVLSILKCPLKTGPTVFSFLHLFFLQQTNNFFDIYSLILLFRPHLKE